MFHKPLNALSVEVEHESMDGHDEHDSVPDSTHMLVVHKHDKDSALGMALGSKRFANIDTTSMLWVISSSYDGRT